MCYAWKLFEQCQCVCGIVPRKTKECSRILLRTDKGPSDLLVDADPSMMTAAVVVTTFLGRSASL